MWVLKKNTTGDNLVILKIRTMNDKHMTNEEKGFELYYAFVCV